MDEEDDNLTTNGAERDDEALIRSRPVGTITFRNFATAFRIAWNKRQRGKVSMESVVMLPSYFIKSRTNTE